jgi:hypothetical protein
VGLVPDLHALDPVRRVRSSSDVERHLLLKESIARIVDIVSAWSHSVVALKRFCLSPLHYCEQSSRTGMITAIAIRRLRLLFVQKR